MAPMDQNLLERLKAYTVVVADTGDINSIEKFRPQDATTNPSLITAAAQMPEYADIVSGALAWAPEEAGRGEPGDVVSLAFDRLAVEFGLRILKIIPGRVSTEVDARLSFDTQATIEKAPTHRRASTRRPASRASASSSRSPRRGRASARRRSSRRRASTATSRCSSGCTRRSRAPRRGVTLISPFVGRILDWYLKDDRPHELRAAPRIPASSRSRRSTTTTRSYGYKTEVMGASFRNIDEIKELAGCDLLTDLAEAARRARLRARRPAEEARPDAARAHEDREDPDGRGGVPRDARRGQDGEATSSSEGIDGFAKALATLEVLLRERLQQGAAS